MRRQGLIYFFFAMVGTGLFVYEVPRCSVAFMRFGWSVTFGALAAVEVFIAALSALCGWLAFVFLMRAVSAINHVSGGVVLVPAGKSFSSPFFTTGTRVIKRLGDQSSSDAGTHAFTLFSAANKYWVTTGDVLPSTQRKVANGK